MPKASRRLSLAVGEAGANIQRKSESEAAQKLPEIIQKFMPNGLLNCLIVKSSNCQIKMALRLCDFETLRLTKNS